MNGHLSCCIWSPEVRDQADYHDTPISLELHKTSSRLWRLTWVSNKKPIGAFRQGSEYERESRGVEDHIQFTMVVHGPLTRPAFDLGSVAYTEQKRATVFFMFSVFACYSLCFRFRFRLPHTSCWPESLTKTGHLHTPLTAARPVSFRKALQVQIYSSSPTAKGKYLVEWSLYELNWAGHPVFDSCKKPRRGKGPSQKHPEPLACASKASIAVEDR